jgi:hypothetical protein
MIANRSNNLVGSWKLVSASTVDSSGEQDTAPYGVNPVGYLTYTEGGRVTALISFGGRKPLSIGAKPPTLLEEQAEAFKTFLAYGGRYRLSGDTVVHSVEIASIQNWVNQELVRRVRFQDDQIVLVTPPTMMNGKLKTFELVWQRIEVVP